MLKIVDTVKNEGFRPYSGDLRGPYPLWLASVGELTVKYLYGGGLRLVDRRFTRKKSLLLPR